MVIRPPSEARSLILQVTLGCSHNRCAFCGTYLDKPFRMRPLREVYREIEFARRHLSFTRRVFLADGNAMVLSYERLMDILERLNAALPELQRVGIYANAGDILSKSEHELRELARRKLGIVYLGLESGDNRVLMEVNKGATAEEMTEAVRKVQEAGIKASVIALLGLGGRKRSLEHAVATGKVLSEMSPRFISFLTLMLIPRTELYRRHQEGEFELPSPVEMLWELRVAIEHLNVKRGCIFRTNHASNYLPLAGTLPKDKGRLLAVLDEALAGGVPLRDEWMRAL
jgi:radical SAM superfamily enzyme YgiQ (UPF0313 family)